MKKALLAICLFLAFNLAAEERFLNYEDIPNEILQRFKQGSEHTVTQMRSLGVSKFDYDEDSVKFLSDVITDERLHLSEQTKRILPDLWGGYLGEVLIKKLGGKWVKLGDRYGILIGSTHIAFPLNKVHKQIENGEIDSIYAFYLSTVKTANELASADNDV